ncbi:MAG TPA: AMP-binding protein, partial [Burkholderiaceae bacterium]|nr:AMP-binding protein [Burkholderiaceae bacterium]
ANLDEKLQLARQAARELRQIPGLELIDEPQLSTVVFRLSDMPDASGDFDAETRELLRRVNHRGSVFLSPTTLGGRVWIRLCVLSFRSHEEHVAVAIRDIRASAAEIIEGRSPIAPRRGDSISALFVDVARAHPSAPALLTSKGTVTYRTLLKRASRLAGVLCDRGVTAELPVGIALPSSPDAVVAVLGVLLAGGACVTIDPLHPAKRQRQIADDCGTPLILCRNAGALDWLPASRRLDLNTLPEPDDNAPDANAPALPVFAQDRLLYVVYNGASTGRPKAVCGTHAATLRRLERGWQAAPFAPGEVVAHLASLNDVDAVIALFSGLLRGVPSAIIDAQEVADPSRLLAALRRCGATRLNVNPSLLASMLGVAPDLASALPRLKLYSGDGVQIKAVRQLMRPVASTSPPWSRPQVVAASAVDPVVLARLIAQSFAAGEPLAVATAVTADEFFDFAVHVVAACTRSPLSFVSCDAATGALTGFCMAADLAHVPIISAASVAPSLWPTLALLAELGEAYSKHCGQARTGEVVELVVTGVLPGQFGYGVASMLEKRALAAAREMGFLRAVTICTHRVTAQLAQRTGFQRLFAQPYASFEFAQARVFASISPAHGEAAVYERILVETAPADRPRRHAPRHFAAASRLAQPRLRSDELCCTR